jgi:colanic acid/amylovoran biosynthesis glycosyltransferase
MIIFRALAKGRKDIGLFRTHLKQTPNWRARFHRWYQLLPFAGARADVIYFPWNSAAISHLPLFDLGCPVVLSCRGAQVNIAPLDPRRPSMKHDLQVTFQKAAAVHCVSEAIMNEAQRYGLERKKTRIIRPAVDPQFFCPPESSKTELPSKVFRITTTGSLIWRKGYEYALQAIRELKDKGINVQFNILGDGPERQRVLYTIDDLDLNDVVELHGGISPQDVRRFLHHSDAFLLSSLSEGISNSVLEAMACGVPVVTTNCGGMSEAVSDGVEGFVVPTRDADSIARALTSLWEHPEIRLRMGLAGRQRIERFFSLSRQVEDFNSLWKGLAF